MSVIDRIWEQAEPLLFISKEEFVRNLDGWEIEPVEIDGTVAFATMTKGPAFHCHSFETGQAIPLHMLKAFVQKIIDQYGYATTKTPHEAEKQHRFNRIFGFKKVGEDEFDVHYRIDKIR